MHISHNWGTIDDFVEGGFAMMERKPTYEQRAKLFERMITNSKALSDAGVICIGRNNAKQKNSTTY